MFSYNRAVNNFGGVTITNVYNKTVINNVTRVSFNGGTGGTVAQPTPQEQAAAREQHVAATTAQIQHEQAAITNKALLASENQGRPAIAATSKPGEFTGKGVVAAREPGPAPQMRGVTARVILTAEAQDIGDLDDGPVRMKAGAGHGRGRWMDDVFVERLWRSLKREDIYLKDYGDGREAKAGISSRILFYNTQRFHQALANRTPMAVWREAMPPPWSGRGQQTPRRDRK